MVRNLCCSLCQSQNFQIFWIFFFFFLRFIGKSANGHKKKMQSFIDIFVPRWCGDWNKKKTKMKTNLYKTNIFLESKIRNCSRIRYSIPPPASFAKLQRWQCFFFLRTKNSSYPVPVKKTVWTIFFFYVLDTKFREKNRLHFFPPVFRSH